MAASISASFDPKVRNRVTSLTSASCAMRRVVAPRKPCWLYTRAAALRILSRISMAAEDIRRPQCVQAGTCLLQMFAVTPRQRYRAREDALRHSRRLGNQVVTRRSHLEPGCSRAGVE